MAKKQRSIEEQVEDRCKRELRRMRYYTKTEDINSDIAEALKRAPSKRGGDGANYPDIKCLIETPELERIPVMIEVKGTEGSLIKASETGEIINTTAKGLPHYANIDKYAVNGALHYANAILDFAEAYSSVIAVGVNGYPLPDGSVHHEVAAYYVSRSNLMIPKEIGRYSDLSFLLPENQPALLRAIEALNLSDEELERRKLQLEDEIERRLKDINQKLHDEQDIVVGSRVKLIAGMVMAGLGVEGRVSPLRVEELSGQLGERTNDGAVILGRVSEYLDAKSLPREKRQIIENELSTVFTNETLHRPEGGHSKLRAIYADVKSSILPFLTGELHNLDFTGRMFNVLNAWVDVPDGARNDVVLTPRYVTQLMARICGVNKDSYVWDLATGSGGFLISAMHEMIADAKERITSPAELDEKIRKIKAEQLLGVEKLSEIYMLAVLNMILMKDGSANLIQANSLTEFTGHYEQGDLKGRQFPADVLLLNPPYSAEGKGFVFVAKALSMMKRGGMAAVLIQENAGIGAGLPYTREILRNNTLVASVRMGDIFCGKATVQPAIYVFRAGEPHHKESVVRFIDFTNDGYTRTNRKKSSQSVNLRDTDNARMRYAELVTLVRFGKGVDGANLHFYQEGETYIEDTVSLAGDDWTFSQHRRVDANPAPADYDSVVKDFLTWQVTEALRSDIPAAALQMPAPRGGYASVPLRELFDAFTGDFDRQAAHIGRQGNYVVSAGASGNGIIGRTSVSARVVPEGSITVDMFGNVYFQPHAVCLVTHARVFALVPRVPFRSHAVALYFVTLIARLTAARFSYGNMASWNKIKDMEIPLPLTAAGDVDYDYMHSCMQSLYGRRLDFIATMLAGPAES